jgi:glutathione S-transferase
MRRLYHRNGAGRPPRVIWALEEAGAEYELVVLSADEASSDEHRGRQPLGRVPVLEDEQGLLFESAAICLQIADQHPDARLIGPLGSRERGLVYQWVLFGMDELEPAFIGVARSGAEESPQRTAALERWEAATGVMSAALDGREYLVADRFTVADIVVGGVLTSAKRRELVSPGSVPGAYLERLAARPAYARAYG